MEHLGHAVLALFGISFGLAVWFWDSIRRKNFKPRKIIVVVFVLLLFTFVHLAPSGLLIAQEHLLASQNNYHPCCSPQSINKVPELLIVIPKLVTKVFDEESSSRWISWITSINNKSPPQLS
ncbi:MAG TPA: hypothetical protein VLE91_00240 [Candidatus Saccharimonadales bacterium]|nr:hypothetical protein [Candidatus Saccharimonadales bacterium]